MAAPKVVSVLLLAIVTATIAGIMNVATTEATWCVARSDASYGALQSNLDWACSHGADCGPIRPGGICFYPNTIQNHASYAFDSYYQRMRRAPGSCYFGGTATVAVTNPSMILMYITHSH